MDLTKAKLEEYAAFLERLSHLPLVERVFAVVAFLKSMGLPAFCKRGNYVAVGAGASTVAQTYQLRLERNDGLLIIDSIGAPSSNADTICSSLRAGGAQYVVNDALMDAWAEVESSEDQRAFPWPVVMGAGDTLMLVVTGTGLTIIGIPVRGFHVDEMTAAIFRQVGELNVEGFNITMADARVMTGVISRVFQLDKEITHLVSKETLTGDTVRDAIGLQVKGIKLNPRDVGAAAAVIPPLSTRKSGARVSIGIAPGDSIDFTTRYTSAAAGTAKLQMTALARRRYREHCA